MLVFWLHILKIHQDLTTGGLATGDFRYRRSNVWTIFPKKRSFVTIFGTFLKNSKCKIRTNHKILNLKRTFCSKNMFLMSIYGFIFKLVLIESILYYILLLRQIASLPADLATGGGLTARFPPVERSWCTTYRVITCIFVFHSRCITGAYSIFMIIRFQE